MHTIAHYLDQDHRRCDDQYTLAEADIARRDWTAAAPRFTLFLRMFERHLDKEERILFPCLDRAMGNAYGPTAVMRAEHGHLRTELDHMRAAILRRDSDAFFDHADTLRVLMRQHNLKEEGILYPHADRVLAGQAEAIVASMEGLALAEAEAGSPA
ncbi:hemerythrin domain-containing protein [Duganella sp. HH101]|uniref:hemerythrin domain-containing protein n=1 Tax=Duganella sp. HH101 TaxID=1781066 RepID=UPI000874305F|nr:hemerythrin domain-containing protein [Duganella sp. HH101]OFA03599.1 iron-sulfur cluster repair protein YtfE [Duganella sp. HH101]